MKHKQSFLSGLWNGIPIALGYLAVSFAVGINARNVGMSVWQAALLSLTNVTSAGEAAGISMIAAGTTYFELAVTQIVINIRYLLMSCSLSQRIAPETSLLHRLLMSFGVTDEIFGIASAGIGRLDPFFMYGAFCVAIPGWTIGTFLGALLGSVLPTRLVSALSVALYAMFIAIVIPPTRTSRALAVLVPVSMLASWIFSVLPGLREVSEGFRIIILTVVIAGCAAFLFPNQEDEHAD